MQAAEFQIFFLRGILRGGKSQPSKSNLRRTEQSFPCHWHQSKRKKQAEKTIAAKAFIADFLEENGASGVQDIAIEIEKSLPRTRELMRELIQENIVEAQGEGPARKYILKDNQSKLK